VSRQGGDEFVVLLSEVEQPEDAAITASRMLRRGGGAFHRQHDLHVTTSIGVSVYPDDGLDAETLIKNADTAMYQAKENGRQSYQFFKPAMNVRPWSGNPSRRGCGAPWNGTNSRCTTSRRSI
jgi:diguanylate cyclase (GGDEF)-like protein